MSKKRNKPALITSNDPQGIHFLGLCSATYNKARLNSDQAQHLNENGGEFQKVLGELMDRFSIYNRFQMCAATEIMGVDKVIEFCDAVRAWGVPMPTNNPTISYSDEVLYECAEENKQGTADWRLVYVNGFSLRKQEEIRGRNRKNQPCFDPDYTWWLESQQDKWATQSIKPGYRLLNLRKNLFSMIWQSQETEIAKLGENFERAEEQAVAEVCLTVYMIKKERLLRDWYHQGLLQSSNGDRVCVGGFDEGGFRLDSYWDGDSYSSVGVVLSRKS